MDLVHSHRKIAISAEVVSWWSCHIDAGFWFRVFGFRADLVAAAKLRTNLGRAAWVRIPLGAFDYAVVGVIVFSMTGWIVLPDEVGPPDLALGVVVVGSGAKKWPVVRFLWWGCVCDLALRGARVVGTGGSPQAARPVLRRLRALGCPSRRGFLMRFFFWLRKWKCAW